MMGLEAHGQTFKDRFLIADVRMEAPFPSERWFWFDPPFHPNQSVLLHHQPDNVWRIDFQLGWDADPVAEKQPERVIPRVRALLGEGVDFELEWVSVYTFSCERMDRFRHGRVLFIGDAAHRVSPFGARGANSGLQDAENLAWKLRMVLAGDAPDTLLDTYATEREFAADDNIRHSTRSTDFITPKSAVSRLFRDAALRLAKHYPFARTLVNSGRLSTPTVLEGSRSARPTTPTSDVRWCPAVSRSTRRCERATGVPRGCSAICATASWHCVSAARENTSTRCRCPRWRSFPPAAQVRCRRASRRSKTSTAWSPNAMTHGPARCTSSARTSTSAHAGAASIPPSSRPPCAAPWAMPTPPRHRPLQPPPDRHAVEHPAQPAAPGRLL